MPGTRPLLNPRPSAVRCVEAPLTLSPADRGRNTHEGWSSRRVAGGSRGGDDDGCPGYCRSKAISPDDPPGPSPRQFAQPL